MMQIDRDALICDLAETYGIFAMKALSPVMAATLFCGLRRDSRCMMALSGETLTLAETLDAIIADRLGILCWQNTKDGQSGRNAPKPILEQLQGQGKQDTDTRVFASGEDFDRAWAKMTGGDRNGG